jgi:hypothetical protein
MQYISDAKEYSSSFHPKNQDINLYADMMKDLVVYPKVEQPYSFSCLIRSIQERSGDPKLATALPNMYYLPILGQLSQ